MGGPPSPPQQCVPVPTAKGTARTPGGGQRQPRYFDEEAVWEENTKRCHRCGQVGHLQRDCTYAERQRPCYLCSQYGHTRRECPNTICYRCNRPGHMARDCPNRGGYNGPEACLRCGRHECRWEYCDRAYLKEDLANLTCYVCGAQGHLCCIEAPQHPPKPSCFLCGDLGHIAQECRRGGQRRW